MVQTYKVEKSQDKMDREQKRACNSFRIKMREEEQDDLNLRLCFCQLMKNREDVTQRSEVSCCLPSELCLSMRVTRLTLFPKAVSHTWTNALMRS